MVEDLLLFKSRCDDVLHKSFANDEHFGHALKESFENFINKRQNKPAEMIAKFVDSKLKSGKGVTEEEVERDLDRCLVLFRFIQGTVSHRLPVACGLWVSLLSWSLNLVLTCRQRRFRGLLQERSGEEIVAW